MFVLAPSAPLWSAGAAAAGTTTTTTRTTRRRPVTHYGVPTYANSTLGDDAQYDDPVVREAAIEGLGRYNGAVVAIDPNNGRILTVVNQQLAFSAGFIPCSTIKPVIALAALGQGVINQDSMIEVAHRRYMNLTEALAHSNNAFFESLGREMGFDTVLKYARMMGLGERTGYDIPEEQAGVLPTAPPEFGGVARMSSFGQGIQITPLELGSVVATIANGGTEYYLQYPRSQEARDNFEPRIKRQLPIEALLPEIRDGMLAAVLYGTAQRSWDYVSEQPLGKTGSCSDSASRIGWFVSYADELHPRIVLVVLMRGHNHVVEGPMAAGIAGRIYHRLHEENYLDSEMPAWESRAASGAAPASAPASSSAPPASSSPDASGSLR
ncbi:MAG: penicillin-binding transpeptidase domain-containing protein [Candidatus Acidiferrales bacterium]